MTDKATEIAEALGQKLRADCDCGNICFDAVEFAAIILEHLAEVLHTYAAKSPASATEAELRAAFTAGIKTFWRAPRELEPTVIDNHFSKFLATRHAPSPQTTPASPPPAPPLPQDATLAPNRPQVPSALPDRSSGLVGPFSDGS